MIKSLFRRKEQFSIRKFTVGVASVMIGASLIAGSTEVKAAENKNVEVHYVADSDLTEAERAALKKFEESQVVNEDTLAYYYVYKKNAKDGVLPNTTPAPLKGIAIAGTSLLVLALFISKRKNKLITVCAFAVGMSGILNTTVLANSDFERFFENVEVTVGGKLPIPKQISGYTFTGYYFTKEKEQEVKPIQLENSGEQVIPSKPINPVEPTKPTTAKGDQSNNGAANIQEELPEGKVPTEPTKPTEPVSPTEPTKPVEPVNPIEPTKPAEPSNPVPPQPEKPVEPTMPTTPEKPVEEKSTSTPEDGKQAQQEKNPSVETNEVVKNEEMLDFKIIEEPTEQLFVGETQIKTQGVAGKKIIKEVQFIVDGKIVSTQENEEVIQPINQVTLVGAKSLQTESTEEVFEDIDFETENTMNPEKYTDEVTETGGEKGRVKVTYKLTTDNKTGKVTRKEDSREVIAPAVKKVIETGTKLIQGTDVEETIKEIDFETERKEDKTLKLGTQKTEQEGKKGSKKVTKTYKTIKGVRTGEPTENEEVITQPTKEIILVGTSIVDKSQLEKAIKDAEEKIKDNYIESTYTNLLNHLTPGKGIFSDDDATQDVINDATAKINEMIAKLELKAPEYTAVEVQKEDANRQATLIYTLSNPQENFISGKVKVYVGDKVVAEKNIVDGKVILDDLAYNVEYKIKPEITYNNNLAEVSKENEVEAAITTVEIPYKKIEFKEISTVELYKKENGTAVRIGELKETPTNLDDYYVIVKSDTLKDTLLSVNKVEEVNKDGKQYYKFTITQDEVVQGENTSDYVEGYSFVVDKLQPKQDNVYYSVSELLSDMNNNKAGTYVLGANMDFSGVSLANTQKTYVNGVFTGKLLGKNGDTQFGIYGLVAPLFETLKAATVENVVFKDVNIKGGADLGTLAKTADNSTIKNIAVKGIIEGERNIGGIINIAQNGTNIENAEFEGKIIAPANTGGSSKIGGLVGQLNASTLNKGHAKVDITVNQANDNNYTSAGLVGQVNTPNGQKQAHLQNSYAEGTITNTGGGRTAGITASNWYNGRVSNVLSDVKVNNGYRVYADAGALGTGHRNLLTNFFITENATGQEEMSQFKVTKLDAEKVKEKISSFGIEKIGENLVEQLVKNNEYKVNYSAMIGYDSTKDIAYKNIQKLIPYYNKELVIKYGNKVSADSKFAQTEVLSATPMTNGQFTPAGDNVDKVFIHYKDGTKEVFKVANKSSFTTSIMEYEIPELGVLYTPRMKVEEKYTQNTKEALSKVELYSQAVYTVTNRTKNEEAFIKELYYDEGIVKVKEELENLINILLEQGANYSKIVENKEAIVLALVYMNNNYDIKFGEYSTKDLMLTDFYNKDIDIVDTLVSIGTTYEKLRGRDGNRTFNSTISGNTASNKLLDYLTYNRKLFTDFTTDDEWFKDATKDHLYIAERASKEPELADAAYKVYDKLQKGEYMDYMLPLLNLKKSNIYIISNYSTFIFGSKDRSPNRTMEQWKKTIDVTADRTRDHFDLWYRIAEQNVKNRLVKERNTPTWDGYGGSGWADRFGRMGAKNEYSSIREFFGPIGKYYGNNGLGAYANMGDPQSVHYVTEDVLSDYGHSVFTHEMTHNYDNSIYLGGYGRREGMGPEAFARGLLETPEEIVSPKRNVGGELGLNLIFDRSNASETWYNRNFDQFKTQKDIDDYMKRYIDAKMTLDYAETDAILKHKDNNVLMTTWFKKMDKELKANGKDQIDLVRNLTDEEKADIKNIVDINDLIDKNYVNAKGISNGKYDGNGVDWNAYVKPHTLAIFYGGNTSDGAAGAATFKYNAFHMWAYYGYSNGFIGYTSNKYAREARAAGERLSDKFIINKVSNGKFQTLEEWKKAYYAEVKERANQYFKPVTVAGVTISSYDDLVNRINEILDRINPTDTAKVTKAQNDIQTLKTRVFKGWLDDSNSFQENVVGR